MKLTAIVMAGGKGKRLSLELEKPLLLIGGKPMIQRVIEALSASPSIGEIVAAVSPHTPRTRDYLLFIGEVTVLETSGIGYHEDMKEAISRLGAKPFLVTSADLPFLSPAIVEEIAKEYFARGKPALTVVRPLRRQLECESIRVVRVNGANYVPCGINVVDGSKIDEPYLEEDFYAVDTPELFNVNTLEEYLMARRLLKRIRERGGI